MWRGCVARRVLVVDDNAVNRRVLTSLLEKLDCRVDTAANGQEAVALFKANPCVRLVLTDCEMPLMDGYQAARLIRALAPNVRITGVSGYQGASFL